MKQLVFMVIANLIYSCGELKPDHLDSLIPGVYVKHISDEFTQGTDTLIIEVKNVNAASYSISRRMRFHQTIDGKELSPQYKTESWTAIYNKETKQLEEDRKGKIFTLSPENGTLSMGGSEYQKIK